MEVVRNTEIKYMNPTVPDVALPTYGGAREERFVPDTLDLQEMAALAINGLTEPTDPDADYEIYWRAAFNTNPPVLWHSESDIVQAKFMEALPLLRLASGSDQNLHVEKRWMEVIRQMQGPDGLLYLPKVGRPWCKFGNYGLEPPGEHYFSPWFEGRLLGAMLAYYLLTGDEEWNAAGGRVVDGLDKLAIHEKDKAHFANHEFGVGGEYVAPADPSSAVHNLATYHAWCIQGLANYGKHTGDQPAIDLARKMSRWVIEGSNYFGPNGEFLREYPNVTRVHFHGHTVVLLGVLDAGIASGDESLIAWAKRGFEYGMSQGECRLGYFAEWLNMDRPQTLELCELADMIALALKLSECGAGDYWDMADRWIRNLFFEGQLRNVTEMYWLAERTATTEIARCQLPPDHVTERAVERNVGAFGGWLSPNDWMPDFPHDCQWRSPGIMHCCTGNATRTIYYAWEKTASERDGQLRVNLLFNHSSRLASVESHIPYTGRVDVRAKQPVDLSIRIPEWVEPEQVVCMVNGSARGVSFDGRYARAGKTDAGDIVTLTFPIAEATSTVNVEKRTYRVLLRGNTCVAIDPPGRNVPLFKREHYRRSDTRWKKTSQFTPDRVLNW
jgi:hypothetical protein